MTTEHPLGGHNYRIGKMDARTQFHIVRRVAPVFADNAPMILSFYRAYKSGVREPVETYIKHFETLANALKKMTDEDVDYVIDRSLSAVHRQMQGGAGWGPMVASNGMLMYQDMGWADTMQLVTLVLKENILSFLVESPSPSSGGAR